MKWTQSVLPCFFARTSFSCLCNACFGTRLAPRGATDLSFRLIAPSLKRRVEGWPNSNFWANWAVSPSTPFWHGQLDFDAVDDLHASCFWWQQPRWRSWKKRTRPSLDLLLLLQDLNQEIFHSRDHPCLKWQKFPIIILSGKGIHLHFDLISICLSIVCFCSMRMGTTAKTFFIWLPFGWCTTYVEKMAVRISRAECNGTCEIRLIDYFDERETGREDGSHGDFFAALAPNASWRSLIWHEFFKKHSSTPLFSLLLLLLLPQHLAWEEQWMETRVPLLQPLAFEASSSH